MIVTVTKPAAKTVNCNFCHGKGWYLGDYYVMRTCHRCDGSGKMLDLGGACPDCKKLGCKQTCPVDDARYGGL